MKITKKELYAFSESVVEALGTLAANIDDVQTRLNEVQAALGNETEETTVADEYATEETEDYTTENEVEDENEAVTAEEDTEDEEDDAENEEFCGNFSVKPANNKRYETVKDFLSGAL